MKHILNLIFLLLLCIAVKAQTNTTAEVFIEVSDEGRYTIALDGQSINSTHSRFRFFEVMPGKAAITITSKDGELLTSNIMVSARERYIFSYSKRLGLKAVTQLPFYSAGNYMLDNWDGALNPVQEDGPRSSRRRFIRAMDQKQFGSFMQAIKRGYFDDDRHTAFAAAIKDNALTVDQLMQVLKLYSFDDGKLKTAFYAYDYLTDRQSFFKVKDVLVFPGSQNSIDNFLLKM